MKDIIGPHHRLFLNNQLMDDSEKNAFIGQYQLLTDASSVYS